MATSRKSPTTSDQLTFWSAGPPVKPSRSRADVLDWMIRAATYQSNFVGWLDDFAPAGWLGRTSPEFCPQAADGISPPLSASWATAGMGGPIGSLTLNMSEHTSLDGLSLSDDGVCSLSDILEDGPCPPQYYLSPKACQGILRRVARRGRDLPPTLARALSQVAAALTGRGTPLVPVARGFIAHADGADFADVAPTLDLACHNGPTRNQRGVGVVEGIVDPIVAFDSKGTEVAVSETGASLTLRAMAADNSRANGGGQIAVALDLAVRRLTPRECERLQGFPDDWTAVSGRRRPLADGPRYKMLGNSMPVNVMQWLGDRIALALIAEERLKCL